MIYYTGRRRIVCAQHFEQWEPHCSYGFWVYRLSWSVTITVGRAGFAPQSSSISNALLSRLLCSPSRAGTSFNLYCYTYTSYRTIFCFYQTFPAITDKPNEFKQVSRTFQFNLRMPARNQQWTLFVFHHYILTGAVNSMHLHVIFYSAACI